MPLREMTVEFGGRVRPDLRSSAQEARRAVGEVGDETERSSGKVKAGMGRMSSAAAGFAGGVAANIAGRALDAVGSFVGGIVTATSDANETLNKSRTIFGSQADAVERWAATSATSLGLSRSATLEYTAGLGDMAAQLGFTQTEAAGFGQDLVQLSSDFGSFNNLETGDVLERISAALRGEYDSLQAVIPNINAARVEQEALAASGKKTTKELTAQDKALAVQAILHKDGARAMGDFAKTSGGFANQQKILAGQLGDVQATLGQALLPVLVTVMGFVTGTAVPAIAQFATYFGTDLVPQLQAFGASLSGVWPVVQNVFGFIGANLPVILPLVGFVLGVVAAIRVWTIAQAALNVVLTANPIGLVVVAIGALVAGLIYAYQNSETFRTIVNTAFTTVRRVVVTVVDAVVGAVRSVAEWLTRTWQVAVDFGVRFVRAFLDTNRRVINTVTGLARGVIGFVTDLRDRAISTVINFRDRFVSANVQLRDRAIAAVVSLRDRAVGFVINLRDRVILGAQTMRDRAVSAVLGLRDRAVGFVVSLRDRAATVAGQLRDGVAARVVGLRDRAVRTALSLRDRVMAPFRGLRDGAVKIFSGLRDSVGRAFGGLLDRVRSPLRTLFSWINRNLISPLNSVTSKFGLNIPDLPRFHRGTSRVGAAGREYPAVLLGDEAVLNPRATRMLGRQRIERWNRGQGDAGEAMGGPGDWWNNFTEFISRPAQLVAKMATEGVKWAVSQVLGAVPNIPRTGVPIADILPAVFGQLKTKALSWASDQEAKQQAELGAGSGNIGSGPWVKPVGAGIGTGYLGYPGHYGVDFPAGTGTPVHAVSNALVTKAASLTYSYGRHLFLRHADGLVTVYAHLSQLLASVGQRVKTGQVIGRVGSTGNSTGPHLHFETRVGGGYPGPNPRSVMGARGVTLDSGGMLQPGYTLAYNGTGGPEPVLTGDQWATLTKAKDAAPVIINLTINGAVDKDATARQLIALLDEYYRRRGGVRVNAGAR